VVVTIDPARRLMEALGLRRACAGVAHELQTGGRGSGRLWAIALDPQLTIDRLVEELAPSPEQAERVRANRIYRELLEGESGSQEIAAVAELYALAKDSRFDAIVLDTPPAANALEFLETPTRLRAFLESRAIALLLAAAGVSATGAEGAGGVLARRALGVSTTLLLKLFARATGSELISELAGFLRMVSAARGQLVERAEAVEQRLRDPTSGFAVVSTGDAVSTQEAAALLERLAELGLPLAGVVFNRIHPDPGLQLQAAELERQLAERFKPQLARRLATNLLYLQRLAAAEREVIAQLQKRLDRLQPLLLPDLDGEVEGLNALDQLAGLLLERG